MRRSGPRSRPGMASAWLASGFQRGFQRDRTEPVQRGIGEKKKPACAGFLADAPKRTRTSTRLSRTRPSTWRVYQFRHRREEGEYSPGHSQVESVRAPLYLVRTHVRETGRRGAWT